MVSSTDKNFITDAVNKYSDTVFRIAFQYTRNRPDAEDIVQEVYLQLLKTPPLTDDGIRRKAWLIRVAINKSKDRLRTDKRRLAITRNFMPSECPSRHDEVFEALDRLPERDRNALYLHYYEGYTAREIAEILGGNERALTKCIGRAREKLKNFLKE